ncbi:methyltransferase domain-containing protein [Seiridium cupressi]
MEVMEKDNPRFWKLHNVDATYWSEYIDTRPTYDRRIFDRVIDYHSTHSTRHSAALDIGTGSGSALEPLTKWFDHVVATDNDPTSLSFAKQRHSSIPVERLSYTLSSGEELLQHHSPGSFDLITCAETFPLMDTEGTG